MNRPQRLADRQEERSAAYYGGRRVPKSGSGDSKGDIETADELIECKHTERLSFSVVYRAFYALLQHALLAGKRPVMEIEYTTPLGQRPCYVVVLDRDDYKAMRDELGELRWRISGLEK